jgi:hypothetical protein
MWGGYLRADRQRRHQRRPEELAMINDPYVALDLHRARVESLTEEARVGRLGRALRRHASSTGAPERAPSRWALRRRPA